MLISGRTIAAGLFLLLTACSHQTAPSGAADVAAGPAASPAAPPAASAHVTACEMVTAAEMSAILGSPVAATPDESSAGSTRCTYKTDQPIVHTTPYVELSVDWGSGAGAMAASGALGKAEPGIADPYAGIGDQAMAIGPALMIRSGDDLVTIVQSGIDDMPGTARKIFNTAKPRI